MNQKPIVFVSSTIYDFQDLRSSLHFWLTEIGFEVRMSDRNDFNKNSSVNSYQACLDSIAESDYFILLIGSRVGGLYSEEPKVSITQKEYQWANELALKGKIKKLFIFVRKSILDIKEDRKNLGELLKSEFYTDKEYTDEQKEKLAKLSKHTSKFVNDADFIFSFIREVSKADGMKESIKNPSDNRPTHNWINPFNSFKDITDVLKYELSLSCDLSVKRWNELVCLELCKILSFFIDINSYYEITTKCDMVNDLRDVPRAMNKEYTLSPEQAQRLYFFAVFDQQNMQNIPTSQISAAIQSGVYLNFDKEVSDYRISNVHKALNDLLENITSFKGLSQKLDVKFLKRIKNKSIKNNRDILLDFTDLNNFFIISLINYHNNILKLSKYLINTLKGNWDESNYPNLSQGVFSSRLFPELTTEEIYEYMINSKE